MSSSQEQFAELTRRTQENFKNLWQQWTCVPHNSVGLETMIMGLSCENTSRHASEACL